MASLAVGPPAAAGWSGVLGALPRPTAWVLIIVYEIAIMIVAFSSAVLTAVKERWITRIAEQVDVTLQRWLTPFRRAYLRSVRDANSFVDLKGLVTRGEFTPRLNDIFVELAVDTSNPQGLKPNPVAYGMQRSGQRRSIWHWILAVAPLREPLVVVGPPGSGKTTLLRHIAYSMATTKREGSKFGRPLVRTERGRRVRPFSRIPVLIELKRHTSKFALDSEPTLAELIRENLRDVPRPEPSRWVEHHLSRGNFILLLDGLDEVTIQAARTHLSSWIDRQRDIYGTNIFVVTSRPFGYKANPLDVATVVQVRPFAHDQIHSFLHNWYLATTYRSFGGRSEAARRAALRGYEDLANRLASNPQLEELAANPLLLTMIANVHNYRDALPGSRAELYGEVCEVFLGRRHQARSVPIGDITALQRKHVLQYLAYHLMMTGRREVAAAEAAKVIGQPLSTVNPDVSTDDFLERVEQSSGILIERESGIYGFAHLTFQEYLAACHIRDNQLAEDLASRVTDDWWRECALLYSAIADATPVVRACLRQVDRGNTALLAVAVACVAGSLVVSNDIRDRMREMSGAQDVRDDPARRRQAGVLRLLQPDTSQPLIAAGHRVSRAVTNLEYQAFVDDSAEPRCPDHWSTTVYPRHGEHEPISGIRAEDAAAFAQWITQLDATGRVYRLPARIDIQQNLLGTDHPVYLQRLHDVYPTVHIGPSLALDSQAFALNSLVCNDPRAWARSIASADILAADLATLGQQMIQKLVTLVTATEWSRENYETAQEIEHFVSALGEATKEGLARPPETADGRDAARARALETSWLLHRRVQQVRSTVTVPSLTRRAARTLRRWLKAAEFASDTVDVRALARMLDETLSILAMMIVGLTSLEDRTSGALQPAERLHLVIDG